MTRHLPAKFDSVNDEANSFLERVESKDPDALARYEKYNEHDAPSLQSIQAVLAREYGFAKWADLKNQFPHFDGPISPEEHARAYDQIAQRWRDDSFPRARGVEEHKRALSFLGGGTTALDVGCGCNTRISSLLESAGMTVDGVDISKRMIELARTANPGQRLFHADICTWELPRRYDFITAWESIMHVPLNELESVILKLMLGLNPGGVFIFTLAAVNHPTQITNSGMGPNVYNGDLGLPQTIALIAKAGCICKHLELYAPPFGLFAVVQRTDLE